MSRKVSSITLMVLSLILVLLGSRCTSLSQEEEYEKPIGDSLMVVLCDLTLSSPESIEKIASSASQLLKQSNSPDNTIRFYLVADQPEGVFFEYTYPKSEVRKPEDLNDHSIKKWREAQKVEAEKFDQERAGKAKELKDLLISKHKEERKRLARVPRSCLLRSIYYSANVLKQRKKVNDGDFRGLTILSDFVIMCRKELCQNDVMMSDNADVDELITKLDECSTQIELTNLDRLITVVYSNSNGLRYELLEEFWLKIFKGAKMKDEVKENLFFTRDLPDDVF